MNSLYLYCLLQQYKKNRLRKNQYFLLGSQFFLNSGEGFTELVLIER